MARKSTKPKAQSKPKSNRGGRRAGAGRKTKVETKLRQDVNALANEQLAEYLPQVLKTLYALAVGVKEKDEKGKETGQYAIHPSVQAGIYLADRRLGKPRQSDGEAAGPIVIEVRRVSKGIDGRSARAAPGAGEGEGGGEAV